MLDFQITRQYNHNKHIFYYLTTHLSVIGASIFSYAGMFLSTRDKWAIKNGVSGSRSLIKVSFFVLTNWRISLIDKNRYTK